MGSPWASWGPPMNASNHARARAIYCSPAAPLPQVSW